MMGKKTCILGSRCPNKIAKKNVQFQLSENGQDHVNLKENCTFCGSSGTVKKKKPEDSGNLWSISSSEKTKRNRMLNEDIEIDSLSELRPKRKKDDVDADDRIEYLRSQLRIKPVENKSKPAKDDSFEFDDNSFDFSKPSGSKRNPWSSDSSDEEFQKNVKNLKKVKKCLDKNYWSDEESNDKKSQDDKCETSAIDKWKFHCTKNDSCSDSNKNSELGDSSNFIKHKRNAFEKSDDSDLFELDADDSNKNDTSKAGPSSYVPSPSMTEVWNFNESSGTQQSRFSDISLLPKHKLERLLFKSFKLQILDEYSSSSSDENDIRIVQEVKKKSKRKRFQQRSEPVRGKVFKSNQKIGSGFYRWKKQRRYQNDQPETSSESYDSDDYHDEYQSSQSNKGNNDHDYSTSEFQKIAESNIDNLAFETEKLNWDETVMIDESDSNVMPIDDDVPSVEAMPSISQKDDIIVIDDSPKTPMNTHDISDHIYCFKEEQKKNNPTDIINLDSPESAESDKTVDYNAADVVQSEPVKEVSRPVVESTVSEAPKRTWECPLCLEESSGQEIAATLCGHIFCKDCIENYLVTKRSCPTCRKELQEKQFIALYNFT